MTYNEIAQQIGQMTPAQRTCPAVIFMQTTGELAEIDSIVPDDSEPPVVDQFVINYDRHKDPKLGPKEEKHIVRLDGDFLYNGNDLLKAEEAFNAAVAQLLRTRYERESHHVTWSSNKGNFESNFSPVKRFEWHPTHTVSIDYNRRESE